MKKLLALLDTPSLPGALCRGQSALFDERRDHEGPRQLERRHAQAQHLCRQCPQFRPCHAWVTSIPGSLRPEGVVAGLVPREVGKVGRPKKGEK
ncbi:WhiB family transcriptional regulator [Mycobacterium sp. NPDC050853]|uniref:WhiB family transcriptional regulator n=1 Tax=Mycobacterium sp. NPDC050853 TaxID=3155160 RepID=UPI0033DE1A1E